MNNIPAFVIGVVIGILAAPVLALMLVTLLRRRDRR